MTATGVMKRAVKRQTLYAMPASGSNSPAVEICAMTQPAKIMIARPPSGSKMLLLKEIDVVEEGAPKKGHLAPRTEREHRGQRQQPSNAANNARRPDRGLSPAFR